MKAPIPQPELVFERIAQVIPPEFRDAYYRYALRLKAFEPKDDLCVFLEGIGIFAMVTRDVPAKIAGEIERFSSSMSETEKAISQFKNEIRQIVQKAEMEQRNITSRHAIALESIAADYTKKSTELIATIHDKMAVRYQKQDSLLDCLCHSERSLRESVNKFNDMSWKLEALRYLGLIVLGGIATAVYFLSRGR